MAKSRKIRKKTITGKQRAARKRNIKVARAAKKRGGGMSKLQQLNYEVHGKVTGTNPQKGTSSMMKRRRTSKKAKRNLAKFFKGSKMGSMRGWSLE